MKLYFLELSPPCRAVDMVIHSLNLSVEYEIVDLLSGEQLKPEFTKLNPTHTIPMLDDNGFILYDSHAICSYLVSKYGKDDSLYPKDLMKRAKVDEQLHYHNEVFTIFKMITVMIDHWKNLSRIMNVALSSTEKPIIYKKQIPISDENIAKLNEICNVLEKILEKQQYFAGNELTIADISFISLVPSIKAYVPTPEDKYPKLNAWMSRCAKSIKNYDKCNAKGCEDLTNAIRKILNGE